MSRMTQNGPVDLVLVAAIPELPASEFMEDAEPASTEVHRAEFESVADYNRFIHLLKHSQEFTGLLNVEMLRSPTKFEA